MSKSKLVSVCSVAAVAMFGSLSDTAQAGDSGGHRGTNCPVSYPQLKAKLPLAVTQATDTPGNFGNNMWAVVVNHDGVVCAVAFSGATKNDQWLLSRQIAAAKAWTTNGLSTSVPGIPTVALDPLVQPGLPTPATLYGVAAGNPVDTAAAYKGPTSKWGTATDPMVGEIVGGTITFGGGVPLIKTGEIVGGLGISGVTAAQDDSVANKLRDLLGLNV